MCEPTTLVRETAVRGYGENDERRPAQGRVLQKCDYRNYAGQVKPKAVERTTQARLRGSSQRLDRESIRHGHDLEKINSTAPIAFPVMAMIELGSLAVPT